MQAQPRITFVDIDQSEAIEEAIMNKIKKLERVYPHVTACDVMLRQELKNHTQGKLYRPKINVLVPGDKINVNHAVNEDIYVAIRDAFNAAERALKDYAWKQRGDVKHHAPILQGRVERVFEEGFGFIILGDDEFYFNEFNCQNIAFDKLRPGMVVEFMLDPDGDQTQAKRVHLKKKN